MKDALRETGPALSAQRAVFPPGGEVWQFLTAISGLLHLNFYKIHKKEGPYMGYQEAMDALHLRMPGKIPRTEYSASGYWSLIRAVTGLPVGEGSGEEEKLRAAAAFEKAWDFGFTWSILTHSQELEACRTTMGHAVYAEGGGDFDTRVGSPFTDVEQVLSFDPWEAYGARDRDELTRRYDAHYDLQCRLHPDQVNMTGIYITMISGLLEIFGWNWLLEGMGEDPGRFGEVAGRYADWIAQYFEALAACKAPVVMIHDDIVWTSGPFANPAWYRRHVFPHYERLFEPLHRAGKILLYTSDGCYNAFIDDIAACGVSGFVLEPTTDMAYIARQYGKTHAFVGNADCRILTFGSKEEIRREVERCVNIGRECPGFFLAVGNHIPPSVPVENALYYNQCYEELAWRF